MTRPRLLEVAVEEYKNLRGLRVPWAPAQVLYGANASGKTNLLECLVLLAGTPATTWEASPRLAHPRPGSISAVLEVGGGELPARVPVEVGDAPDPFGAAETFLWWQALGARDGTAFGDALASAGLPGQLAGLVGSLVRRPRIRYVLDVFVTVAASPGAGPEDPAEEEDALPVHLRSYGRTLCLDAPPPAWLVEAADDLPPLFRPFGKWLRLPEDRRSPHADLLALPSAGSMPLRVRWIPRTHDGAAQTAQLAAALRAARESAQPLAEAYGKDAAQRWVLGFAAGHLSRELALTLPEVTVEPADPASASRGVGPHDASSGAPDDAADLVSELLLRTEAGPAQALDARAVDLLSDGQRVWFDEAVGSAVEYLADLPLHNQLRAHALATLDDAQRQRVERLAVAYGTGPDALAAAIDETVADARGAEFAEPVYALLLDADPLVRLVRGATLRLRLFDEPERHQHPRAVRRIRDALAALQTRPLGDLDPRPTDVVVSTHSHLMLEPAGWSYLHLRRTPDGVVASTLAPGELTASSPAAAEMGLTRGELLGLCQLILFVEGIHDELVLGRLFGPELRAAGVVVLPMHGTDNLLMLPNLTLVQDYLDCPVAVLADNARQRVLEAKRPPNGASVEELQLHRLRRAVARQSRPWRTFGLPAADVVYYLPDQAVAAEVPGWPGWPVVAAERERAGRPVKRFVREAYGVELDWPRIRRILDRAADLGLPRPAELERVVGQILAWAREARPEP
jgi:hypothetical protein